MTKKELLKLTIFPLTAIMVVWCFSLVLCNYKNNSTVFPTIYKFSYEEKNSIDVVNIGPSTVMEGFIPIQTYQNYGFCSYNYAFDAMPFYTYKYSIEDIIKKQDPSLIVIDIEPINYLEFNKKYLISTYRDSINDKAIKKQIKKDYKNLLKQKQISPIKNHRAWEDGNYSTHSKSLESVSLLKGYNCLLNNLKSDSYNYIGQDQEKLELEQSQIELLKDLLDFCKTTNKQFLFCRFPRTVVRGYNENNYKFCNYAGSIIENYGYTYKDFGLDFNNRDDFYKDYFNAEHTNYFGAKKFTNTLSEYILDNFTINTNHSEKTTCDWNKILNDTKWIYDEFEEYQSRPNIKSFIYDENCAYSKIHIIGEN